MRDTLLVHGTTVAIDDAAILLRGASGSGKSDLALRFLSQPNAWPVGTARRCLVADDQTLLECVDGKLIASAPAVIAGKLEVRGVGIIHVQTRPSAGLQLVVDLVTADEIERMPEPSTSVEILGCRVPHRLITPFEASAPIKLAILLAEVTATR